MCRSGPKVICDRTSSAESGAGYEVLFDFGTIGSPWSAIILSALISIPVMVLWLRSSLRPGGKIFLLVMQSIVLLLVLNEVWVKLPRFDRISADIQRGDVRQIEGRLDATAQSQLYAVGDVHFRTDATRAPAFSANPEFMTTLLGDCVRVCYTDPGYIVWLARKSGAGCGPSAESGENAISQ